MNRTEKLQKLIGKKVRIKSNVNSYMRGEWGLVVGVIGDEIFVTPWGGV